MQESLAFAAVQALLFVTQLQISFSSLDASPPPMMNSYVLPSLVHRSIKT